jgi:hypothetical protein
MCLIVLVILQILKKIYIGNETSAPVKDGVGEVGVRMGF